MTLQLLRAPGTVMVARWQLRIHQCSQVEVAESFVTALHSWLLVVQGFWSPTAEALACGCAVAGYSG